jgi:hypothetical protein
MMVGVGAGGQNSRPRQPFSLFFTKEREMTREKSLGESPEMPKMQVECGL